MGALAEEVGAELTVFPVLTLSVGPGVRLAACPSAPRAYRSIKPTAANLRNAPGAAHNVNLISLYGCSMWLIICVRAEWA